MLDAKGCFLYVCVTGAAMLGLDRDAMLGKTAQALDIKPEFQAILDCERQHVMATGQASQGAMQMTTPLGPREFSYTFTLSHEEQDMPPTPGIVVCTARDVTERNEARRQAAAFLAEMQDANKQLALKFEELAQAHCHLQEANGRLHELAMRDGLTGLLNHRALLERLTEEFGRAKRHDLPLALLLLDIDHFKDYNDAHGHLAGDTALKQVAQVLGHVTRQTDTLARYGGEEFFVVLPQTERGGALVMAERIRQGIEDCGQGMEDNGKAGHCITVSIGVCVRESQTQSPTEMIGGADEALYHAKAAGRNQVCHKRETKHERET